MKRNVTFPVVQQYNWSTAVQMEYPEKKRNISCGANVLMYYTIVLTVYFGNVQ